MEKVKNVRVYAVFGLKLCSTAQNNNSTARKIVDLIFGANIKLFL